MNNSRREIFLGIIVALMAGLIVFVLVSSARQNSTPQLANPAAMPLDATTIAMLTSVPNATPIAGELAAEIYGLESRIQACGDYPPERQEMMKQYLSWLFAPSTIPPAMLPLFSPNPTNRLIFAIAADTSTEWRRKQRPADSCLVPIGRTLDEILISVGENPINIYD